MYGDRGRGRRTFDKNEEEFHPEGAAEDAVLAEVDAETLVFSADEDGADNVTGAVDACQRKLSTA